MNHYIILFCFLSVVSIVSANIFEYKFGVNKGEVIHTADGTILPFAYETKQYIPVPRGMDLAYVLVRVHSLSPPKVDFENSTNKVTIRFSVTQITMSSYSIVAKAVSSRG